MTLYDFTFYDLIRQNALSFRDKRAWYEVDEAKTLTFSQVKDEVDRIACGFRKLGIKKGDRIGILGKNRLEYFLVIGAAAALGAILLPINWRLSEDEVAYNLNDCEPKILFADNEFHDSVSNIKDKLSSIETIYSLEKKDGEYPGFNTLINNDKDFERAEVKSDDGFVIIHTAAVEGRPRGALLSHNNVLMADMHFCYYFNLTHRDVHLNFLPLFHVGGLFMATTAFQAGALNTNITKFDAAKAVALIEEKRVSFMMVFTPILNSIIEEHEKTGHDIKSLRAVMGLETPENIERYQKTTGGTFWSMYGQTETSCVTTFGKYDDRPGSAGRVLPMAEVMLVDDYDQPVPTGKVGEITVRGPMVFKGYWNLEEDTKYAFRDGRHHTGDLGRFDEEGFLFYAGRKAEKDLIKPGGENVYPAEVEKAILQHPAVEKTVVFGVPDPKWKEGIKAVCRLKEGENLDPQALIDFVGERIARFKKPQYVEFIKDFPLTEEGYPDRQKIKETYGGEQ